ncbi:acylphosphatase [Spirochaeta africana]|nr:acylphosphatase [Spirochaeta africana]
MRYYLVGNARGLGLTGWVRNRSDGSVECLVQGDRASIRQFLQAARTGPPLAQVDQVKTADAGHQPQLNGFEVRY